MKEGFVSFVLGMSCGVDDHDGGGALGLFASLCQDVYVFGLGRWWSGSRALSLSLSLSLRFYFGQDDTISDES